LYNEKKTVCYITKSLILLDKRVHVINLITVVCIVNDDNGDE